MEIIQLFEIIVYLKGFFYIFNFTHFYQNDFFKLVMLPDRLNKRGFILNILLGFFHVNKMFRKCSITCFLSCCISYVCLYYCYYYNVIEYSRTVPFTYFSYPLEQNLTAIVDNVLAGRPTAVQPLNFLHSYPFVLNCEKKCKDEEGGQDNVYLLIVIKSSLENFDQRNMIRRTWGRQYGMNYNIRRVFLLGVNPKDKQLQQKIGIEQQDYDDIVQQFFIDTYFNNTLKMMMGFQWAVEFCDNAKFVAFFDDDYYVNINRVVHMMDSLRPTEYHNTILGYIWKNAMPMRIRDNKWYISLKEYPFRFWPNYVTAGSYFAHMATVERLKIAMQYVKIIRFDDIFLGIVAYKLGIHIKHNDHLYFYDMAYDKYKFRSVIAAHGFYDVEFLYKVWKEQRELDKIL